MYCFVNKEKYHQIFTFTMWFYFSILVCARFSFLFFGFTLVIKMRNLDFESHWNTSYFLIRKDMVLDLNMSHEKMSDFVLFPMSELTLVEKLRNLVGFLRSLKNFNVFWWQKWCQIWSVKQCLIWFKLRCKSRTLARSWEIQILNCVKIV